MAKVPLSLYRELMTTYTIIMDVLFCWSILSQQARMHNADICLVIQQYFSSLALTDHPGGIHLLHTVSGKGACIPRDGLHFCCCSHLRYLAFYRLQADIHIFSQFCQAQCET
jgi:hypothetical protein